MMKAALALLLLCATAAGAPRPGANHRLGDDSFAARFGRAPSGADDEALRMRVHLQYVRALLAARTPEEPRRRALLGLLDEYIAKGTIPRNTYVPWRSPVFIDADGAICAVGYLIERTAGRALAEAIAAEHRLAYLEDIAAARPDVAAWIARSGFTLEELASIQPGYDGPWVMHTEGWEAIPDDGPYHETTGGVTLDGAFTHGHMTGVWTRTLGNKVLGRGSFRGGDGTWRSFHADGKVLAEGAYVEDRPHGEWRLYHPSGRLSAVGPMRHGKRSGTWRFFYDDAAHTRLSIGRFANGETLGGWRHFGPDGALFATTRGAPNSVSGGMALFVEPRGGIRREVHEGGQASSTRVDVFARGKRMLWIYNRTEMHDERDRALARIGPRWYVVDGAPVPRDQQAFLARVARWRAEVHVPVPRVPLLAGGWKARGQVEIPEIPPHHPAGTDDRDDMAIYLADNMTWFYEWPHVDGAFEQAYGTMPGYARVEPSP